MPVRPFDLRECQRGYQQLLSSFSFFSLSVTSTARMMVFLCFLLTRAAQVRCAWFVPHLNHGIGVKRGVWRSSATHLLPRPSRRMVQTPPSQPPLLAKKWGVGDAVSVKINNNIHDNTEQAGVIQGVSGGGWYSVRLLGGTGEKESMIIKCRSPQLSRLDDHLPSIHDTTITTATTTTTTVPSRKNPRIQTFSPSNLSRTIVHPDAGKKPDVPPPPPTMYDLDAAIRDKEQNVVNKRDHEYLEQVRHHAGYDKWVVFTDLHCSPSSLETCLKVLGRVHELAVERDAGVLFLGDFWHHRGTLRVDCLNSVLEHFRGWEVPMVMIPGNHDQVTLDGHNHGLTPFENAYRVGNVPGPLIFSYPTKFRDALFVPHIRSIATMESILQSSIAQQASALFVHADVTGALMNDLIVSLDGIPPASFPSGKKIYSGHFHKPHTVKASHSSVQIEYLGSPYETTLSEAQQAKTLAVLDANDWKCIEYIPIDIGRRHFKISSWAELSGLTLGETETSFATVRSGDRIVATIPHDIMKLQEPNDMDHIKHLRAEGVVVEIREVKKGADQAMGTTNVGGSDRLQEMSPESTWRAYLHEEEHERQTITRESSKLLLEAGLEILHEIESSEECQGEKENKFTDLSLTRVSLEGFGPFREKTSYPLSNRGLVLLKGTNNDGGSDSNGSGKSSLAMAALWALTGSMDPRRAQDGKVSDVIHDESKVARVTLDGTLNGIPFCISRTKTASKNGLVFQLNGEDLTTQSVKETQAVIEELMGVTVEILSRTMFHGQHAMNEMLEATDAKLKEELSLLVPLKLWQTAATTARGKGRAAAKKASELEGMISLREHDLQRLVAKYKEAESIVNEKQAKLSRLETLYEKQKNATHEESKDIDFHELEIMFEGIESDLMSLTKTYEKFQTEKEKVTYPLREALQSARILHDSLARMVQQDEREEYAASLNFKLALQRVQETEIKWSVNLQGDKSGRAVPDVCPTCSQPIGDGHSHEAIELQMSNEIDDSIARRNATQNTLDNVQKRLQERRGDLQQHEEELISAERALDKLHMEWQSKIDEVEEARDRRKHERNSISEQMAAAARKSQAFAKMESALSNINMEKTAKEYAQRTASSIEQEVQEVQHRLEEMKKELEAENKVGRVMLDLADFFGQRGVQTFVLQNVVEVLQACSQTYLDGLSDGTQRLDLALDAGDRISRSAYVAGADGIYKERPLATLSGGQWRRCSLALTFGFAELIARHGKFRPSMCVLDEPLTHLDRSGRSKVGEVIRKMLRTTDPEGLKGFGFMGMSTVLIILQDLAAEELDEAFDCIDEVIKEDSASRVKVDGFFAT